MALMDSSAHNSKPKTRLDGNNMAPGAMKANEIRRWVEDWKDPYLREEEQPGRPSMCSECGAIYANHRWYAESDAPMPKKEYAQLPKVLCPADRRIKDRLPGGILTLSGDFLKAHRDTIEELIHNESKRARASNELERIMQWENGGDSIIVETTNPKLAQRIGHALEKAYHGTITYKWSDGNRLARVDWRRDA